jgi:hypothetical protein
MELRSRQAAGAIVGEFLEKDTNRTFSAGSQESNPCLKFGEGLLKDRPLLFRLISPAILRVLLSLKHRAFSSLELRAGPSISPGIPVVSKQIRKMTKPGDPDLYVQFDQNPDTNAYHCWPYPSGNKETCS